MIDSIKNAILVASLILRQKKSDRAKKSTLRLPFFVHSIRHPSPNPERYFIFRFILPYNGKQNVHTQNSYFNSVFACSCKFRIHQTSPANVKQWDKQSRQLYNIQSYHRVYLFIWRVVFNICCVYTLLCLGSILFDSAEKMATTKSYGNSSSRLNFIHSNVYICETNSNERKGKNNTMFNIYAENVCVCVCVVNINSIFSFIFWFQAWTCTAA